MEISVDGVEAVETRVVKMLATTKTLEEKLKVNNCTKEDAIWRVLAQTLCRPSTVRGILEVLANQLAIVWLNNR
jgi:hypothetical protein